MRLACLERLARDDKRWLLDLDLPLLEREAFDLDGDIAHPRSGDATAVQALILERARVTVDAATARRDGLVRGTHGRFPVARFGKVALVYGASADEAHRAQPAICAAT